MLFISLEISSLIFIFAFMGARYFFAYHKVIIIFLSLLLLMMIVEGILDFLVYKVTGEINTFQIVVVIFLVYAATFGIYDFKKLDYTARVKIGKWSNVQLVSDDEVKKMRKLKHQKVVARKSQFWFYIHTINLISAIILYCYF